MPENVLNVLLEDDAEVTYNYPVRGYLKHEQNNIACTAESGEENNNETIKD